MPGKFIFKEIFSCCTSYRLREILSFPSSASIVEGKRGNTCNHVGVSPLNALMYDQISKLRARGVEAAVLGVKKGIDADSPVISQWELESAE